MKILNLNIMNNLKIPKKVALFGGTFNPIHKAHINIIINTLETKIVDEVWIMPAYNPYHKNSNENFILDFRDRIQLINISINSLKKYNKLIKLFDIEKKLFEEKIITNSYTSLILDYIYKEYVDIDFYFLLGSDSIFSIKTWYNYEDVINKTKFLIYQRDSNIDKLKSEIEILNIKANIIYGKIYDISSTKIREYLKNKSYNKLKHYLIKEELEYIKKNQLYE